MFDSIIAARFPRTSSLRSTPSSAICTAIDLTRPNETSPDSVHQEPNRGMPIYTTIDTNYLVSNSHHTSAFSHQTSYFFHLPSYILPLTSHQFFLIH